MKGYRRNKRSTTGPVTVWSISGKWIDMYLFSISPNLVVVDRNQPALIILLKERFLEVNRLKIRQSKVPGDGYHCITLDMLRTGTLK